MAQKNKRPTKVFLVNITFKPQQIVVKAASKSEAKKKAFRRISFINGKDVFGNSIPNSPLRFVDKSKTDIQEYDV